MIIARERCGNNLKKEKGGYVLVTCHPLNVPRLRFVAPVPNSTIQYEKLSGVGNPRKSGLISRGRRQCGDGREMANVPRPDRMLPPL